MYLPPAAVQGPTIRNLISYQAKIMLSFALCELRIRFMEGPGKGLRTNMTKHRRMQIDVGFAVAHCEDFCERLAMERCVCQYSAFCGARGSGCETDDCNVFWRSTDRAGSQGGSGVIPDHLAIFPSTFMSKVRGLAICITAEPSTSSSPRSQSTMSQTVGNLPSKITCSILPPFPRSDRNRLQAVSTTRTFA